MVWTEWSSLMWMVVSSNSMPGDPGVAALPFLNVMPWLFICGSTIGRKMESGIALAGSSAYRSQHSSRFSSLRRIVVTSGISFFSTPHVARLEYVELIGAPCGVPVSALYSVSWKMV